MRPDRPAVVRRFALEWVSLVADASHVPALERLLRDPEVGEMARWALVRVPGPAATQALCRALRQADPKGQLAVLAALGQRADPAAVNAIQPFLASASIPLRLAAARALSCLPSSAAAAALAPCLERKPRGPAEVEARVLPQMREAYLNLGHTLAGAGQRPAALAIFERMSNRWAMLGQAHATVRPGQEREQPLVISGLGKAGGQAQVPVLTEALRSRLPATREAALRALVALAGTESTRAIAKALPQVDAGRQVSLIWVLGERRDPAALPALLATRGSQAGRAALCQALAKIGDGAGAPALVAMLADPAPPVREAAEAALARLPGDQALATVLAGLKGAGPDAKAALVRTLSYREHPRVAPALLAASKDPQPRVRAAAVEGLGRQSQAGARFGEVFLTMAGDQAPEPAAAAIAVLIRLKPEPAAGLLLELAQQGNAAAAHGYIALGLDKAKTDPAAGLEMLTRGLALAKNEKDQALALEGLAAVGDQRVLPLVLPYLEQAGTRKAAVVALFPIAGKLQAAGDKQGAIDLYQKAIKYGGNANILREAGRRLHELGVELDMAGDAGFVTHWWVLGPLAGRQRWAKADAFPVDAPPALGDPVKVGDQTLQWKPVTLDDPTGMLDFERVWGGRDDCTGYAYAELTSPQAQEAVLSMGSDDSLVCWLNGKQVHEFLADRGYSPDEDQVPVHLEQGINRLLIKVSDFGGEWAAGVRVIDAKGQPLRLEQREG